MYESLKPYEKESFLKYLENKGDLKTETENSLTECTNDELINEIIGRSMYPDEIFGEDELVRAVKNLGYQVTDEY